MAKEFPVLTPSPALAECVGLVLGDGCISRTQLQITLNSVADRQYLSYVRRLLQELFLSPPGVTHRKGKKAVVVVLTGVEAIKRLQEIGLQVGNKIELQVYVPQWIQAHPEYARYCVRGLMDTDGGIFWHRYQVNDKRYQYRKLCFSNLSQPLRQFVFNTLQNEGFHPYLQGKKHVWLYSEKEVRRYLKIIGSSNQRLVSKFA